jgi:tetratricopeptide (TPR) repeat protein
MVLDSRKNPCVCKVLSRCRGACCLTILGIVSLVGCGKGSSDLEEIYADLATPVVWSQSPVEQQEENVLPTPGSTEARPEIAGATENEAEPRVAGMIALPVMPSEESDADKYWSFPNDDPSRGAAGPLLAPLPPIDEPPQAIAQLLPPQAISAEYLLCLPNVVDVDPLAGSVIANAQEEPVASDPAPPDATEPLESLPAATDADAVAGASAPRAAARPVNKINPRAPVSELSSEEQRLLQAVIRGTSSAATGVFTDARLEQEFKKKIGEAYSLANRRAHYAAQQELIEVLRMVSQARDTQQGEPERTVALAAGLRALDEAEDFAPHGTQLEAELNLVVLTASHRTPIAKEIDHQGVLPQQMMAIYYRYAQLKLALAVAGEPAGSMALHALGKIYSQLGKLEPQRHRLASRRAVAFQQAALLARDDNHLAAHELAVLLADAGHLAEAQELLRQVAAKEPNAIVFRNLANVQEKMGMPQQAANSRAYAEQLARQGATGTQPMQMVSPETFTRPGNFGQNRVTASRASAMTPQPMLRLQPPNQYPQHPTTNWR